MGRPYIICHIVTSLDGKVTGGFSKKANTAVLQKDLIDQISRVMVPAVEPSEKAVPLFQTGKYQSDNTMVASFRLKEVKN